MVTVCAVAFDTFITRNLSGEMTLIPRSVVWLCYECCLLDFRISFSVRETRVKFVELKSKLFSLQYHC
jgi:hypothetical protein